MEAHFDKEKKVYKLKFKGTAIELLKRLKINHETVIVVRDGEVLDLSESIEDNDMIKILSVVSGG